VRERVATVTVAVSSAVRDPRGQTAAEYLGVLLVVVAIILALIGTDPGQAISDKLSQIVRDIAGER
jgi:pilus assembly protein Flp/PilA